MNQLGKIKWIGVVVVVAAVMFGGYSLLKAQIFSPVVSVLQIQYQPEKGSGVVNIRVRDDVFLGVGMITGLQPQDGTLSKDGFTGSVSLEALSSKSKSRVQVDRIRFIETTEAGDGRVFEPVRVYDNAMKKGQASQIQFLEGKGKFPFVWESGKRNYVFFTFSELPADVMSGDLVMTYNVKFPDKKYPAYFEDRLSFQRKTYGQ